MISVEQDGLIFGGQLSHILAIPYGFDHRGSVSNGFQIESEMLPAVGVFGQVVHFKFLKPPHQRGNPLRIKAVRLIRLFGPLEEIEIRILRRRN